MPTDQAMTTPTDQTSKNAAVSNMKAQLLAEFRTTLKQSPESCNPMVATWLHCRWPHVARPTFTEVMKHRRLDTEFRRWLIRLETIHAALKSIGRRAQ